MPNMLRIPSAAVSEILESENLLCKFVIMAFNKPTTAIVHPQTTLKQKKQHKSKINFDHPMSAVKNNLFFIV